MKKNLLIMSLVLSLSFLVCGCKNVKDDIYKVEDQTKIYENIYEEELEGNLNTFTNTIKLFNDNTGVLQIQDVINFTYDEEKITCENGEVYSYAINGEKLILDYDGNKIEFVLAK